MGYYFFDEVWQKALLQWHSISNVLQRHRGRDKWVLEQRNDLYKMARNNNPSRWSDVKRNWSLISSVDLNPEIIEEKVA